MKKRPYLLPPRLTLALSILFLLASAYLFWANNSFDMPTAELALRKSAAEHALTYEDLESYPLSFEHEDGTRSDFGSFYFARRADSFYVAQPKPLANTTFWIGHLYPLRPYQDSFLNSMPVFNSEGPDSTYVAEKRAMLVTTPDPAVARMTLTQYTVPLDADVPKEELIANYSDTQDCVETAPGSGVWVCYLTVPEYPYASSWSFETIVRAYAADGKLIYSTPEE